MSNDFFMHGPTEAKEDDGAGICDITAATIIIDKDDDEYDLNQTAATIIINPCNYDTNNEVYQLRNEMQQLRNEISGLRQRDSAFTRQIQNLECREECTNARIENLENTVAELVRYINTKG